MKAAYVTPLLQVADVERSLRFYGLLGFETADVHHGGKTLLWARAHCEGGALMFARAEHAPASGEDRFLLYLYTPDLPALCVQLAAAGIDPGPVSRPEYMQSGEISLKDPDGYIVLIGHWGEQEHDAWERERQRKREAGLIP